ncbi:MAG: phosphomannomutase/phosphoglucomutase [Pseudohongiellaceae bacterium]
MNNDELECKAPAGIFRAYDIRGIYAEELNEKLMRLIGGAVASEALAVGIDTLLCARDARLSSPALFAELKAGILSAGCNVVDLGIVPTPLLYFATHTLQWQSGVMLTASHNPAIYNGLKVVLNRSSLADNQIQAIRRRIEYGELATGTGHAVELDAKCTYIEHIVTNLRLARPVKVVLDCGNAVTSVIAPALFRALGCEVVPLFCELDGSFPNHEPDPTQPENMRALQQRVTETGAYLGIAFDGDGDRLGLVADNGALIDADQLMLLLIKDLVPYFDQPRVIFDVKCSNRLARAISACGGIPVMNRSGHSFMKQKMQETGAILGGEYAAHIFIRDRWFGFDDGMYAAARVLEILTRSNRTSSEQMEPPGTIFSTTEIKVPVFEKTKFALMEKILTLARFDNAELILLDGIRAEFDDGWGLVRASNTSPALLLRFEANTAASLERIKEQFRELLLRADNSLDVTF